MIKKNDAHRHKMAEKAQRRDAFHVSLNQPGRIDTLLRRSRTYHPNGPREVARRQKQSSQ